MNIYRMAYTRHIRFRFIESLPENGVVLDIGCGDGEFQKRLRQHRPDLHFISIDKYDFSKNFSEGSFFKVNIEKETIPVETGSFDAVFCAHVIEHILSYDSLIAEIQRVLKPTGSIYIEAPSTRSLFLPSLNLSCRQQGTLTFFDDQTHIRPFTQQSLYRIGNLIGCKSIRTGFARNWLYCFFSPLLIVYAIITNNRQVLATTIWSLTGWCVYLWGEKKVKNEVPV